MKKQTHIEELFDLINGGDDVDAAAEAQEISENLLKASKKALGYLTDLGIDLEGEEEEIVAGIRLRLHEAIAKAEGRS